MNKILCRFVEHNLVDNHKHSSTVSTRMKLCHVTYAASKPPHSEICSNKRPTSLVISLSVHASDTRESPVDSASYYGCAVGGKGRKESESAKKPSLDRNSDCLTAKSHFQTSGINVCSLLGIQVYDTIGWSVKTASAGHNHLPYASKTFLTQHPLIRHFLLAIKTAQGADQA